MVTNDRAPDDLRQARLDIETAHLRSHDARALLLALDVCERLCDQGVPLGSLHGSAANSLLAYTQGATVVDPLVYDLPFDRIVGESLPDFTLIRVPPSAIENIGATLDRAGLRVEPSGRGCLRVTRGAASSGKTYVVPDWRVAIASTAERPDIARPCRVSAALKHSDPCVLPVVDRVRPSTFEEVMACLAIARPGPIASGLADAYGRAEPTFAPSPLRAVLARTRGVLLYHEDVARVGTIYAGLSVQDAGQMQRDLLYRHVDRFPRWRELFAAGAVDRGAASDQALDVFAFLRQWTRHTAHRGHFASCAADLRWLEAGIVALGRSAKSAIAAAKAESALRTGCREFAPIVDDAQVACAHCTHH